MQVMVDILKKKQVYTDKTSVTQAVESKFLTKIALIMGSLIAL
jgi:hypothetical protein